MSIQAVSYVLSRTKARLGDRLVLISLANHYNESIGLTFPSVHTIAKEAGLSDRQVQRAITRLMQFNAIWPMPGKSEWNTKMYRIHFDKFIKGDNLSPDKLNIETQPKGDKSSINHVENVTQSIIRNPEDKKSLAPYGAKVNQAFKKPRGKDEIWDALLEACSISDGPLTKSARGAYNRACAEIKSAGGNPSAVKLRAEEYRMRWPKVSLTPPALARHWSELGKSTEYNPFAIG